MIDQLIEGIQCGLSPDAVERFGLALEAAIVKISDSNDLDAHGSYAVMVFERNPVDFIAGVLAALRLGRAVFLANPNWGVYETKSIYATSGPMLVLGEETIFAEAIKSDFAPAIPAGIYIPTGGSSARLRFARYTLETLRTHVDAFVQFFGFEKVNSFCLLPLYHVSGWMQVMRSGFSGGRLRFADSLKLKIALSEDGVHPADWCLSLVPTQLKRILDLPEGVEELAQLRAVFLGGAPLPDALLRALRDTSIPAWLTYGMTETASMVAAASINEVEPGKDALPLARLLPHTQAQLRSGNCLWLNCAAQATGYWPQSECLNVDGCWMETGDRAELSSDGRLRILGRVDDLIISGGEKVDPKEVERLILNYPGVDDCRVYGVDDAEWGQIVVALISSCDRDVDKKGVCKFLKAQLAPYKIPKKLKWVTAIPRNEIGKIQA